MWPFKKKELPKLIEVSKNVEIQLEEWTPVPGYEKYYIQNKDGKVKSLGNEFDFHVDAGSTEETAAFLTMHYLKGYFSKDTKQVHNFEKIIEVMKKKWHITTLRKSA